MTFQFSVFRTLDHELASTGSIALHIAQLAVLDLVQVPATRYLATSRYLFSVKVGVPLGTT